MYDVIGDVHGHADELVQLLEAMGYSKHENIYYHPERKVIFLGDFIDRGPQIRQVLEIVRPMVESGAALSVMGNHEFNALAYHTEDPEHPGDFLRRHIAKNEKQHHKTMEQLSPEELASHLAWFGTLPMWLELDGLRVVHACWDNRCIEQITHGVAEHGGITSAFLRSACKRGSVLHAAVEVVLKGKEMSLPDGIVFYDKDGNPRTDTRTRWYFSPEGQTYRTYAFQTDDLACDLRLETSVVEAASPYPATAPPVFVGHYWLSADRPELLAPNVACVDYSVAKGGFLCAYRWNGEQTLSSTSFVWG